MSCFRQARWPRLSPTNVYITEYIAQGYLCVPTFGDHVPGYSPLGRGDTPRPGPPFMGWRICEAHRKVEHMFYSVLAARPLM